MTTTASPQLHSPVHPARFVAATSMFDGHDAAINVMRRLAGAETPEHLDDVLCAVKAAGFDMVIVETPGIGQGDAGMAQRQTGTGAAPNPRRRCA